MSAPASVLDALHGVDAVFEKKLRPPQMLCMDCAPPWTPERERFDAIVRAHRAHRLTLPIAAIGGVTFGHGPAIVHSDIRRLAWFVPAILASALEGDFPRTVERVPRCLRDLPDGTSFLPAEIAALVTFVVAAFAWRLDESDEPEADARALGALAVAAGCGEAIFDAGTLARVEALFFCAETDARRAALSAVADYLRDADRAAG